MTCRLLFTVIVKGVERGTPLAQHEARHKATKLRNIHGKYNVWLRPYFFLEAA